MFLVDDLCHPDHNNCIYNNGQQLFKHFFPSSSEHNAQLAEDDLNCGLLKVFQQLYRFSGTALAGTKRKVILSPSLIVTFNWQMRLSGEESEPWGIQSRAFAIAVALFGPIFIIGLVGNGIVVAVITTLRRRGQKSSVQLFLLHLAISDLLVCLLCIPLTIFTNFHYPTEYQKADLGLCKLSRFMQLFNPVISVSLLAAISIDRYMTFVKQEVTYTQRAWYLRPAWLIFFAWVYGTSQTLPVFHSADVIPIKYNNSTIYYCTTTQGHSLSGRIYLGLSILLGFVIPLAVLTVSYYRVIRIIWTRHRKLSSFVDPEHSAKINNEKLLKRSRKRVLRVLVIVVICYVVCWLPFAVYHGILEQKLKKFPNPMDVVRLIAYGLGIVNSICNPFIYYFNVSGKSFSSMKRQFLEVMGGRPKLPARSVELSGNHF